LYLSVFLFILQLAQKTGLKPNGCTNKKLNACLLAVIFSFYFSSPLPDRGGSGYAVKWCVTRPSAVW